MKMNRLITMAMQKLLPLLMRKGTDYLSKRNAPPKGGTPHPQRGKPSGGKMEDLGRKLQDLLKRQRRF